jgi:hypothetical protein
MAALIFLFLNLVASLFKSKSRLEAENAALRQQLIVLQRKVRGRVHEQRSAVLRNAVSLVSVGPSTPLRSSDPRALASCRFSPLWNRRISSRVAVSGDRFRNAANYLLDWPLLKVQRT